MAGLESYSSTGEYGIDPREQDLEKTNLSLKEQEDILRPALCMIDHADYKRAVKILRHLLSKNSKNRDGVYWLGYCFQKMDDPSNALICFNSLIKIDPSDESYSVLGDLYYDLGEDLLAKKAYETSLEIINYESPLLFNLYKKLGNIYLREGDFESAEEYFNRAYVIYSNSDVLLVNFGTLEIHKGNLDEAVERFRSALNINQLNDNAWVGLALISKTKSDVELANAHLKRALECNPINPVAIQLAVQDSFERNEFDVAIEYLQNFLEKNPDNSDLSYTLAGIFYRIGSFAEARIELERTLSLEPNHILGNELSKELELV